MRSGWAMRCRHMPDRRRQIIVTFLPGDLLLSKQPDDIIALTQVSVDVIPYDTLQRALDRDADLAMRLMWQLGEDERRLHNWVVGLGRANAAEKLATFLLELRGRLLAIGFAENNFFGLPMTQRDIGDHLGLTPVHVNRVLRHFREAGIVSMKSGTAYLKNIDALHRIAYPAQDVFERETSEFGGSPP